MCTIVTGGAGFIGSHLSECLLAQGKRVLVFDSLWTGSTANIEKFRKNEKFKFIKCDVRNDIPLVEDVREIYHLACPASPDRFDQEPIEILETCFEGTKNMLDLATKARARILIASTSEIYGDPKVSPQSEKYLGNTNSFGPRSCYDEGKRITEALAYGYQQKHGLEVRIARIFNAYGPSMKANDGRAVPNFITAAIQGNPISIYGDGSATRSFQYVADCVEGLMLLMRSEYSCPVNIGSDVETRVDDVARMVAQLVAAKLEQPLVPINHLPAREDDPHRRRPDIGLAKATLGWKPMVALPAGLETTVDWFLQQRKQQAGGKLERLGKRVRITDLQVPLRPVRVATEGF